MTQIDISVIVPAFNEEDSIGACLSSLQAQCLDSASFEVIVVDDGSTDRTPQIVQEHAVQLLTQSHQGPAIARNRGAAAARGTIFAFLDADMTFAPDFLAKLVAPIQAGRAVGTFTRDAFVSNRDVSWARFMNISMGLPPDRRMPADFGEVSSVFRAITRTAFEQVGGYDDMGCGEDSTIARKLGVMAIRAEGPICYHRNPATVREVFQSARWYGKSDIFAHNRRNYLRFCPPIALLRSTKASWVQRSLSYGMFKLVQDTGTFTGFLDRDLFKKHHAR